MVSFRKLDIYRKPQRDAVETTNYGAMITLVCLGFIVFLLVTETLSFLRPQIQSVLFVDEERQEDPVWVFLNISFPRLNCDFLGLDLQDELGRHEVGFSQDNIILKTPLVSSGLEGCRFEAQFSINRVPGNFHLSTHSAYNAHRQIDPAQVDMSHVLHELRFGDKFNGEDIPGTYTPIRQKDNSVKTPWMSYDYFLRIVPTIYEDINKKATFPFQYTYSYKGHVTNHVPAVWFRYDLNPITVKYTVTRDPLYAFFGRIVAYIGGTFSVASMIDSIIFTTSTVLYKLEIGKYS